MQCSSCGASDPREGDNCPECQAAYAVAPPPELSPDQRGRSVSKTKKDKNRKATKSVTTSTLIEFPGGGRVPQWRKELSDRVREVQKRRALEAASEAPPVEAPKKPVARSAEPAQLGLVPRATAPAINPIVMKALLRIERAHRAPVRAAPNLGRGGPALARLPEVIEDPIQKTGLEFTPAAFVMAQPETESSPKEHVLAVVPPLPQAAPGEVPQATPPRKVGLINDGVESAALSYLEKLPNAHAVFGTSRDDRAGLPSRILGAVVDLIVIAFASCPFAAAIELWGGDWNDLRVKGLMAGIAIVVGFLYLTIATALTGRTLGMRVLRIRAVDVHSGLLPSGSQSSRRALGYIFSLACAGLGVCYALIDAEHRTAHDHFSGTIVVRD